MALRAPCIRPATGMALAFLLSGGAILCVSSARAEPGDSSASASITAAHERADERRPLPDSRPVGLMINGQLAPDPVLFIDAGNVLLVRQADVAQAGLLLPGVQADAVIAGEAYIALSATAGLAATLDDSGDFIAVTAPPEMFPTVTFGQKAMPVILDEIVPAGFVSYDLTYSRWNGKDAAFGFFDAGVSGDWGLFGTTALIQNQGSPVLRLDSYFQRDWPDKRIRLVIGDTTTRATEWNQPARYSGIRIGTDFALQPAFVPFALPSLSGAATMPSTVDLVSQSGSQTLAVQPGAFTIDFQPVFSGAGEVTMTVTDITGLSRRVTQSFYTSPRLLRPGLAEFSLEAGLVRENYGIKNFDYGEPFAAGFLRLGVGRALTLGGRLALSPDVRMGGLGAGVLLLPFGEFGLAGAVSESVQGTGALWRAQFQRIAPSHALTIGYQWDNGRFAQIGDVGLQRQAVRQPRRELAISGSVAIGPVGDAVVGYLETRTPSGQSFTTSSLSLAGNFKTAFYNLGVRHTRIAEKADNGAFLSLSVPLGPRSSARIRADDGRMIAMMALAPPTDLGVGYELAMGYDVRLGEPVFSAASLIRTTAGDIELAGDRNGVGEGFRISARGALTAVTGKVVATPRLDDAFALVELDSKEDVTLYLENRPMVMRGGQGRVAILSGLQPYAENRIAIDVASLPITAEVAEAEKLVVPGFRQAVRVGFGGAVQNAVTITLVDEQGTPLKAGLEVRAGSHIIGRTGYDGQVFLADLEGGEQLAVSGKGLSCEAHIPAFPEISETRQLGPFICLQSASQEHVG